jgi:hypothetical protein
MLSTVKNKYSHGEYETRLNHPPILWIAFFGWFGSGFGLGWLIRDFTNSARIGAASVVIDVAMIATIVSQCSIVIYLALQPIMKKLYNKNP